jgi:dimethylargininase
LRVSGTARSAPKFNIQVNPNGYRTVLTAITRDVNTGMGNCELTFMPRVNIDTRLAMEQHQHYQSVLSSLGCRIVSVSTEPGLADSVFIEDTAIVLDEIAVMCLPGAESRRAEVPGVAAVLRQYRTLVSIQPPGTLDGGDLLRVGNVIYAGASTRSNQEGIEQLRSITAEFGYSVETVETTSCLHLKSAVSQIGPNTLLVNPDWIDISAFPNCDLIAIDKEEPHAANALRVGAGVIYPSSFPRTLEKLVQRGFNVTPIDVSELQKAEGAVTCCSLIVAPQ